MKTMIYKGDRILWIFLALIFLVFAVNIASAQVIAKDVIKIKITGNGYSDETFIRFKEGASASYESDKDAWKMFSLNPNVPMIFTKVDGYAVSLNTFPRLENKFKVDLFTKIKTAGNYTLEAKIISPFADSVKIFLVDKLMNATYNVRTDSVINASLLADSGTTARFQLYFSTPVKYSVKNLTCFKDKDGQITIKNLCDMGWQIDIVDENNVFQKTAAGVAESYTIPDLHGGNYFAVVRDFSDTSTAGIKVDQPYPVLSSFSASSETVCLCEGGSVHFYNNSVGAASYAWEYGDGTKSTEFQPDYNYSQPGEYIVTLAVSDGQCSDTSYAAIKVIESFPLAMQEMSIKEEGTLYYDGNNYIFMTEAVNLGDIRVEVINLLGQTVQTAVYPDFLKNEIKISFPSKRNQWYIFNFKTKDTSFSLLTY